MATAAKHFSHLSWSECFGSPDYHRACFFVCDQEVDAARQIILSRVSAKEATVDDGSLNAPGVE